MRAGKLWCLLEAKLALGDELSELLSLEQLGGGATMLANVHQEQQTCPAGAVMFNILQATHALMSNHLALFDICAVKFNICWLKSNIHRQQEEKV
eukprot:3531128-Rhodomonas_salina.1